MGEMVSYIFGTLHNTENAVRRMSKTLQLQKVVNRRVALFTVVATANIILLAKTVV